MNMAIFSAFCSFLIGVLTWVTDSYSPQVNPDSTNSYYNLLVQGFQSGQLNMKMDTPPEFAKLADPYSPMHSWDQGYWSNKLVTSYYKGKFYLYFGVTPALALFWPYAALTGHYLSDRYAVAIFFAFGFLMMCGILCAVRRRYFPETSFGTFAPAIFASGLILGLVQSGSIHDVAKVSGFTFVMLALAGIWLALHRPAHRIWCLLMASLAYGLAVGARQSLLFGAIILLVPVLQVFFEARGAISRRQVVAAILSAIGPIVLIGIGLMVYNDLRFDSPFEFGRRYQLTEDYESTTAQQLSIHYLWFNLRYYFLEPISVSAHFPFLQNIPLPPPPPGYSEYPEYGSILFNYPFIMFVFAVPFIWRNRLITATSALSWFIVALILLFAACALTDCFFLTAQSHYELDFLPPLILLAFIGFLGLDQIYARTPGRRGMVRFGWYVLLGCSLAFNTFANVNEHAIRSKTGGDILLDQNRPGDAIAFYKNAVSFDPREAMYRNQLAVAYSETGQTEKALDELRKALAVDPNCTKAQYNFGSFLYKRGQSAEAFEHFEKALDGDPNHTNSFYAFDNIEDAWLLISNPDPSKQNGPLAIKLADAACQETSYKNARWLIISATVHGETGQFDEAVSLAEKAMVAAKQNNDPNALRMAESLLANYRKNQSILSPN